MKKHNISGWDIFHESKPEAPPIISVRIMLPLSSLHQRDGMSSVYINLLRNIIHRESAAFSIAGTPFVSWGLEHITIGIHTLEEDLVDFLSIWQKKVKILQAESLVIQPNQNRLRSFLKFNLEYDDVKTTKCFKLILNETEQLSSYEILPCSQSGFSKKI